MSVYSNLICLPLNQSKAKFKFITKLNFQNFPDPVYEYNPNPAVDFDISLNARFNKN